LHSGYVQTLYLNTALGIAVRKMRGVRHQILERETLRSLVSFPILKWFFSRVQSAIECVRRWSASTR